MITNLCPSLPLLTPAFSSKTNQSCGNLLSLQGLISFAEKASQRLLEGLLCPHDPLYQRAQSSLPSTSDAALYCSLSSSFPASPCLFTCPFSSFSITDCIVSPGMAEGPIALSFLDLGEAVFGHIGNQCLMAAPLIHRHHYPVLWFLTWVSEEHPHECYLLLAAYGHLL